MRQDGVRRSAMETAGMIFKGKVLSHAYALCFHVHEAIGLRAPEPEALSRQPREDAWAHAGLSAQERLAVDRPIQGGIAVGATNADGTRVETEPYTSQDIMATVCRALGISLETTFTSRSGRPMKIANGGKVVKELFSWLIDS